MSRFILSILSIFSLSLQADIKVIDSGVVWIENSPSTTPAPIDLTCNFPIGSEKDIKLDPATGSIDVIDADGEKHTFKIDKSKPTTTLKDSKGDTYKIDNKTGKVTPMGSQAPSSGPNAPPSMAQTSSIDPSLATIVWNNPPDAKGGLDQGTTKEIADAFKAKYAPAILNSNISNLSSNFAPFKIVPANGIDNIQATITINSPQLNKDSIRFITLSGAILNATKSNNTYTVTLNGLDHAKMELVAVQAKDLKGGWQVIGKLIQRNYQEDNRTLTLIPLGNATISNKSEIETELKKQYGIANGNWTVNVADALPLPTGWKDKATIDIDAGALSCYSAEMKEIIRAYNSKVGITEPKKEEYYIFVSNIPSKNTAVEGEMPRGEHYGFIFSPNPKPKTVVHELGHGAYFFEHFWDEVKGVQKGATSNIMDYTTNPTDLRVFQWDDIHERPADFISPCWKSDEAGQSYGSTKQWAANDSRRNKEDGTITVLTPSLKLVTLPKETIYVYFNFGDNSLIPNGTLASFVVKEGNKEVTYSQKIISTSILGYTNGETSFKFNEYKNKNSAIIGIPYLASPENSFRYYKVDFASNSMKYYTGGEENVVDLKDYINKPYELPSNAKWTVIESSGIVSSGFDYGSRNKVNPDVLYLTKYLHQDNLNQEFFVFYKLFEEINLYPDFFDVFTSKYNFNDWKGNDNIFNKYKDVALFFDDLVAEKQNPDMERLKFQDYGYFDYRIDSAGWENKDKGQLLSLGIRCYRDIRNYNLAKYGTYMDNFTSIESECTLPDISAELIRQTIMANSVKIINIPTCKRIKLIQKLLKGDLVNLYRVDELTEKSILKLFKYCNNPVDLIVEVNKNKLWDDLADAIDDETAFVGTDNYTEFVKLIAEAYGKMIKEGNSALFNEKIKPVFKEFKMPDDIKSRIVTYNYSSFGKRLALSIASELTLGLMDSKLTVKKSNADYNEATNKVDFENSMTVGLAPYSEDKTLHFDPLEPIIVDIKGNGIDMFGKDENKDVQFIPAICLYLVDKKANSQTAVSAIQITVDAVSLAIPGGQATMVLRILNYADKLSSVASLVGSATQDDYPQLTNVLNMTSLALGAVNLAGNIAHAKLAKNAISYVDKTEGALNVANHEKKVSDLAESIIDNTAPKLGDIAGSPKDKKLLEQILEMEKQSAKASGRTALVSKLENAISVLNKGLFYGKNKFYLGLKRFASYWKEGKFYNKAGAGATQIAHIDNAGKLHLDKVDNLANLGQDARLVETIEDIPMGASGAADDVLVFREADGTLKCLTGANCFTAGTAIKTQKGSRAIETIVENDSVYSYDEVSKQNQWQKVTYTFHKVVHKLQRLVIGKDTLYTTEDHQFYTSTGWLKASALAMGMMVQGANGYADVRLNLPIDSTAKVYNFTVANTHTYYVGKEELLVHNDCAQLAKLLEKLDDAKQGKFLEAFGADATLLNKFKNGVLDIEDWILLSNAGKRDLCKNLEALEAINKARKNAQLKKLGFTDELLAKVDGYSGAGFAEIMNDLDVFAKNLVAHNVTINKFDAVIGILAGENRNYRQGMHWVIQDLKNNMATFGGKTISLEHSVSNFRGTTSSIDLFCANCIPANLKIEYKSGPGSITSSTIKEQFIERDLFNANSLDEIQWRMKGTEMTADKLKGWLKEYKNSIEGLSESKKQLFFKNYDPAIGITDKNIEDFVTLNYSLIFK